MASERVQRRIDRLIDHIEAAGQTNGTGNWCFVSPKICSLSTRLMLMLRYMYALNWSRLELVPTVTGLDQLRSIDSLPRLTVNPKFPALTRSGESP